MGVRLSSVHSLALPLMPFVLALFSLYGFGAFRAPLPPYDETAYYIRAVALWHGVSPPADGSPLYVGLYGLFAWPGLPPDLSYHLLRGFLAGSLAALTSLLVVPLLGRRAGLWAGVSLALNLNLVGAYTVHLAGAALVALALVLVARGRLCPAVAVLLAGTLVRPEQLIVGVLTLMLSVSSRQLSWRHAWPLLGMTAVVGTYLIQGPTAYPNPGGRLLIAFGQHYAWTRADLGWVGNHWLDWQVVMRQDFGLAETLPQAIWTNPSAFAAHVLHNVLILPATILLSANLTSLWLIAMPLWTRPESLRLPPRVRVVALSSLALLGPWLVIRPRPDYLLTLLLPGALLLLEGLGQISRARCSDHPSVPQTPIDTASPHVHSQ